MAVVVFLVCTVLLSIERIVYFLVWRHPEQFRSLCARRPIRSLGGPVDVLQTLFCGFKLLQTAVFVFWCSYFAGSGVLLPTGGAWAMMLGAALAATGMFLNFSVFSTIGRTGVFYGNKLGHVVPWREGFPFSVLRHPQYVGALLLIWGFFLIMRYPHGDWIVLPILETIYYAVGAHFER